MSFIIECSVGNYGYNCNQSCDGCLSNSCQITLGYCLDQSGCKPGWQYAQSVQNKCDIGMLRTCSIIDVKVRKNAWFVGILVNPLTRFSNKLCVLLDYLDTLSQV